jgi:hypothetical protein
MNRLYKYPRTHHIEGSRFQPGDEDLEGIKFKMLQGRYVVIEEKLDGANAGISFNSDGQLLLQSRGHFLDGGAREKHFALFKTWANSHKQELWEILGSRYVLYGEWLYAKHTIFYDKLPHYFMEFDLLDTEENIFLSTERRHEMLKDRPIVSVPVLQKGIITFYKDLYSLLKNSLYKSDQWRERLQEICISRNLYWDQVRDQTDFSDQMEGLYIKVEEDGRVVERYKYIRASFLTSVIDSGSHWLDRPIVPNQLDKEVDIFAK